MTRDEARRVLQAEADRLGTVKALAAKLEIRREYLGDVLKGLRPISLRLWRCAKAIPSQRV